MTKKRSAALICLGTLLIGAITIAVSYAYWTVTKSQQTTNVIETGCFDIAIQNEQNAINLHNAYPLTDAEGESLTPFTFTVKNTCNIYASYKVNLEILEGTTLNTGYIAVKIDDNDKTILNTLTPATTTITGATEGRKLIEGSLGENETATYNLRLWMDKDTPLNTNTQNKRLEAKVVVSSEAVVTPPSP